MDLRLTDDQQLLHQTTRKFLESTCPLQTVRNLADAEPAGYERDWWRSGADLGWTSLLVTEADGGGSVSGHGLLDLVLVVEEMGRMVSPGPLVPVNVVAEALSRSGTDAQRREVLPGLLAGARTASWCWGTPASGIDTGGAVRATPDQGGFVLDGTSGPTEGGAEADVHLVTVVTTDGPTQLLVPSDRPGVEVEKMHSLDLVRRYAKVSFDHVPVGPEMVLGVAGGAGADVEHQLQTAVVLQCAEMAGAVDRVFEFTVEYASDRYSFGRPLVSYQALKHRFADLKLWVEASLATAAAAARGVDAGSKSAAELVSVAKSYIGERGPAILQDCVQLHGGIGVTWDHDLHLYLRRVMVDATQLGTPREHRERVAVAMGMGNRPVTDIHGSAVADEDSSAEDVESFRLRARAWLADAMPRLPDGATNAELSREDETGERARRLQRTLFDGGFAGICFPVAYGGQGLSRAHQRAFTQESVEYQMPTLFNVPTLTILAATLLDFGTDEQKLRHIPAILRGEELWVQFLSEPSGGSDLAGLVTRATRDGDVFILNGSKIWSTGAHRADYAMCLARTDWHAPKHRGLTMFIMKIHQPGVEVQQIMMVDRTAEFCQEFFDDVPIPASDVVGEVNDGWTVASRLLFHERDAVGGGSPLASGIAVATSGHAGRRAELLTLARQTGQLGDPRVRQLVAEDRVNQRVQGQLTERINTGIRTGTFPGPAGALPRLLAATNTERNFDLAVEIAGFEVGAWDHDNPLNWGETYLIRQSGSLGGGSTEMARNIISERVLGMPREYAADRDRPFDEVRHN